MPQAEAYDRIRDRFERRRERPVAVRFTWQGPTAGLSKVPHYTPPLNIPPPHTPIITGALIVEFEGDGEAVKDLRALARIAGEDLLELWSDLDHDAERCWWALLADRGWSQRHPTIAMEKRLWTDSPRGTTFNMAAIPTLYANGATDLQGWAELPPDACTSVVTNAATVCAQFTALLAGDLILMPVAQQVADFIDAAQAVRRFKGPPGPESAYIYERMHRLHPGVAWGNLYDRIEKHGAERLLEDAIQLDVEFVKVGLFQLQSECNATEEDIERAWRMVPRLHALEREAFHRAPMRKARMQIRLGDSPVADADASGAAVSQQSAPEMGQGISATAGTNGPLFPLNDAQFEVLALLYSAQIIGWERADGSGRQQLIGLHTAVITAIAEQPDPSAYLHLINAGMTSFVEPLKAPIPRLKAPALFGEAERVVEIVSERNPEGSTLAVIVDGKQEADLQGNPLRWLSLTSKGNIAFQEEQQKRGRVRTASSTSDALAAAANVKPTHSSDFTSVNWFGTEYAFSVGNQARAIAALWREWDSGGHSLSQAEIGEQIGSSANNFTLRKVFRHRDTNGKWVKHPAWGTMIQSSGKGVYRLVSPES